jgi:hypothetical protein
MFKTLDYLPSMLLSGGFDGNAEKASMTCMKQLEIVYISRSASSA